MDHLLIFGRRHLQYVLREFIEHYEEARPHQGLGQRTPRRREPTAASETGLYCAGIVWAACSTNTSVRRADTPDSTPTTAHGQIAAEAAIVGGRGEVTQPM
jgi:hypothetical protein